MIDTVAETTHQSHKADADADIPHLNSFISGPGEKEGARFSTLLALENSKRENVRKSYCQHEGKQNHAFLGMMWQCSILWMTMWGSRDGFLDFSPGTNCPNSSKILI